MREYLLIYLLISGVADYLSYLLNNSGRLPSRIRMLGGTCCLAAIDMSWYMRTVSGSLAGLLSLGVVTYVGHLRSVESVLRVLIAHQHP